MNFMEFTEDTITGLGAAMKAKSIGFNGSDEYELALTFFLCKVTDRLQMDTDEGNTAVQECLYSLGFRTNKVPEYLKERG